MIRVVETEVDDYKFLFLSFLHHTEIQFSSVCSACHRNEHFPIRRLMKGVNPFFRGWVVTAPFIDEGYLFFAYFKVEFQCRILRKLAHVRLNYTAFLQNSKMTTMRVSVSICLQELLQHLLPQCYFDGRAHLCNPQLPKCLLF